MATAIGDGASIRTYGTKPATSETAATGALLETVPISGSSTASGGSVTATDLPNARTLLIVRPLIRPERLRRPGEPASRPPRPRPAPPSW